MRNVVRVDIIRRAAWPALAAALLFMIGGCERLGSYTDREHVERARAFQKEFKFRQAEIELKNAVAKNPKNADARWLLAENFVELGRGVEAEVELKRALELGVPAEALKVTLGNALLLQGKHRRVLAEIKPGPDSTAQNVARILEVQARANVGVMNARTGCGLFEESSKKDPAYVPAYWGMALCAEAQRKGDEARARLQEALKHAPQDSRTWGALGDIERRSNRNKEAVDAYGTALKFWPENLDAMLGRAAVRIRESKWKEAEQDIDRVVKVSRGYYVAVHTRGVLLFGQGKYADAKNIFERVLKIQPDFAPSMLWLGFSEYALGNFETAATYLSRFIARNPGAVRVNALLALAQARRGGGPETEKMLKALREANLDDPRMLMVLGQAYFVLKESELAIQQFQKAAQLGPDDADVRINLGLALMQQGKTAEAIAELEQALKIRPGAKQAEDLLIQTLIAEKRYEDALKAVADYEKASPKSAAPPTYRAAILMTQNSKANAAAARRELERAVKLDRAYLPAAQGLARLAMDEGKPDEARQHYVSVLKTKPGDLHTLIALYTLEMKLKRPHQALQYMVTAVEKNPAELGPALLLGRAYVGQNQFTRAIEVTREAARAHPDNADLVEVRAAAYRGAADLNNALAAFRRLANLRPKSAEAHFQLATLHAALKDRQAFREGLNKALALEPGHQQAKVALARLELAEGKPANTVRLARELQKERPKDPVGFMLESDALTVQGDTARAVQVLERHQKENEGEIAPRSVLVMKYLSMGARDKALALAGETAKLHPGKADALELLAQTQLVANDAKGAAETYRRLVELDAKVPESHYKLGRTQQGAGDVNGARASFGKALQLRADYLDAQIALVGLEMKAGQRDTALKVVKQMQTQRPTNPVGHLTEGDVWLVGKEYSKALRAYEAAHRLQPSSFAIMKVHEALERSGNTLEADSRLEAWLKDRPADLHARTYLADSYLLRGKDDLAAPHYQVVVKDAPRNALALNNLAWIYHKQRRPKALELAEQAHKLAPKDPRVMDTLGWILLEQGKEIARAGKLLDTAAALAPDDGGIQYRRAVALARAGDKARARAEIERLLASGKKFPEAEEAKRFLQRL